MLKKMVTISLILAVNVFITQNLLAGEELKKIIRVGIQTNQPYITFSNNGGLTIVDLTSADTYKLPGTKKYSASLTKTGIKIDNLKLGRCIRIIPQNFTDFVTVWKHRYRDAIILQLNSNKTLTAINEVGLENYLYGVMTAEISSDWSIEAIKAQAVASRTYAMQNINYKHAKDKFDLCDGNCCQVYRGVEGESKQTNDAVNATVGELVVYKGKIINSFFHNSCGGYTEDVGNVWDYPESPEFLKGVKCGYCDMYPRQQWNSLITSEEITAGLRKKGYKVGKIKSVEIKSSSAFGRIINLKVTDTLNKSTVISSHKFRMSVDPNKIRSTVFIVYKKNDKFAFTGRGWGHGVGLCQWGAFGLAMRGKNYKEILKYYYPGTEVSIKY